MVFGCIQGNSEEEAISQEGVANDSALTNTVTFEILHGALAVDSIFGYYTENLSDTLMVSRKKGVYDIEKSLFVIEVTPNTVGEFYFQCLYKGEMTGALLHSAQYSVDTTISLTPDMAPSYFSIGIDREVAVYDKVVIDVDIKDESSFITYGFDFTQSGTYQSDYSYTYSTAGTYVITARAFDGYNEAFHQINVTVLEQAVSIIPSSSSLTVLSSVASTDVSSSSQTTLSSVSATDILSSSTLVNTISSSLAATVSSSIATTVSSSQLSQSSSTALSSSVSVILSSSSSIAIITVEDSLMCKDNVDNDLDGFIDCEDSDCTALPICEAPAAPVIDSVVSGDGTLRVYYNDSGDLDIDKIHITLYSASYSIVESTADLDYSGSASHNVSSLTNGTEYGYRVYFSDTDGNESGITEKIGTPIVVGVTNLVGYASNAEVLLTWNNPASYSHIVIDDGVNAPISIPYGDSSYFVQSLTNGQSHTFTVWAVGHNAGTSQVQTVSKTPNSNLPALCFDERDGHMYSTIKIGGGTGGNPEPVQHWMAENLRWLPIVDNVSENSETAAKYYVYDYTPSGATEAERVVNAKATSNYQTYGVLYNWPASMTDKDGVVYGHTANNPSLVQGACPAGWHMPSKAEWLQMTVYVGKFIGSSVVGSDLKANSDLWSGAKTAGTGFNALPGGYRINTADFIELENSAFFWTATEHIEEVSKRHFRSLSDGRDDVYTDSGYMEYGYSVRCVKD